MSSIGIILITPEAALGGQVRNTGTPQTPRYRTMEVQVFQSLSGDLQKADMTKAILNAPIWTPTPQTRMAVAGFVAMHGGPRAMRLPEHEHAEIQIEAHFSPNSLLRGTASALPETYRLIPSRKPHVGSWREGSEVIVFLLDSRQLEAASDELLHRGKYEPAEEIWGADSVIHAVASVLRREFLSGVSDPTFLEAIRTVLSGHLVRSFGDSSVRRVRGRLAPRLLRQVVEMMEENLDSGISVQELANRCRMGTHHFTQLFKASTGCSPYRYVRDLRIARAKQLLAATSLSMAEIAYKLGFASQSHFSTSFRQQTQFTPQKFRRSVR